MARGRVEYIDGNFSSGRGERPYHIAGYFIAADQLPDDRLEAIRERLREVREQLPDAARARIDELLGRLTEWRAGLGSPEQPWERPEGRPWLPTLLPELPPTVHPPIRPTPEHPWLPVDPETGEIWPPPGVVWPPIQPEFPGMPELSGKSLVAGALYVSGIDEPPMWCWVMVDHDAAKVFVHQVTEARDRLLAGGVSPGRPPQTRPEPR